MTELPYAARSVLLAGFPGTVVPSWLPKELGLGLGGVCLYGNNIAPAPAGAADAGHGLGALARSVRELAPTAVLAVDEEGGDVTRLHTATGSPYAGPSVLGHLDSPSVTRAVASGIGAELAGAGIWLDLAPCADVNSDPLNPVIGTRSFGADPALVARHTVAFVQGLAASGVAASVKHFPGHGDTRTDSHHGLPTVRVDAGVLRERELAPFRAAIEAGAATVMTSHVVIEALDPQRPATFSPVLLQDVLRGELGFAGVIVTDALDMAGAQGSGPGSIGIPGAAVRALAAGADLLCLGPGTGAGPETVHAVVRAITEAVADGTLPPQRLLDAAERVARLRDTWTSPRGPDQQSSGPGGPGQESAPTRLSLDTARAGAIQRARQASTRAAQAAVASVEPMPAARVVRLGSATSPAVGETAWGLPVPGTVPLEPADLDTTPAPTAQTLLVVRGATRDDRVWRWIREVMDTNAQARLAELGWPDPVLETLPWSERVIRTFGASAASTDALVRALGWVS